ncbi:MAG TPA: hypothetical protein VMY05_08985 [Acidobacteriota bacterium]|nr:hypothetical protein [Acidobacteriota bacterium]
MYKLLFLLALWTVASRDISTETDKPVVPETPDTTDVGRAAHLVVRLGRITVDNMRLDDTLSLILEAPGDEIAAFALKFGCDSRYVNIVDVLPGEIPDSCDWEYFQALPVTTADDVRRPRNLWTAMALAKMSPDATRPPCLGLGRPASLLRLVLSNENVPQVPDQNVPIFFYWEDCRDNVLSDMTGQTLNVSNNVIDYYDVELPENEDLFPTWKGTPQPCIDPARENHPRRRVDFYNGGVEFRLQLEPPAGDSAAAPVGDSI